MAFSFPITFLYAQNEAHIAGHVTSSDGEIIDFANVFLKDTAYGCVTNHDGSYSFAAPAGKYTLVVSAIGYKEVEKKVQLNKDKEMHLDIIINPQEHLLDEVLVSSTGISRLKNSAFNVVAVDTKSMQNSTQSLSQALALAPGMKLRESGGVGSDMQLMMDGFTGKHIKIFIDGIPQEGVGDSFGLNNIPINYADRIEVYKGVVPVGFGTDAIGGVINVVTKKSPKRWYVDASYSYGSFNTHKSYINFGQTFKNGFVYEVNAFQNYSDNSYYVDAPIKYFNEDGTTTTNKNKLERVKRFHDTYHNEAVAGKIGVVNKPWADRLMLGFTYSNMYKDIQTGVRQEVVFGGKYRKGHSLMPSLEYAKRDLFINGLDVKLTANYNKNITHNVDTASYEYNWRGDKRLKTNGSRGEQSYQHTRSENNNWNATFNANYRLGKAHTFTLNHVTNAFRRNNESLLDKDSGTNAIAKETTKHISGLSYRLMPNAHWNVSVFGKYYNQFTAGPIATSTAQDEYVRTTNSIDALGYGVAGTYFILDGLQAKLSYEKANRLPTNDEMLGDEDLETGNIGLKPENSDNINFNLSYGKKFGVHSVYVEGGLVYRDTKDYIQRRIQSLSGGKYGGTYENHARVRTKGYTLSARYGFADWLSVGGNFTQMDARDNVKTLGSETNQENLRYGARMPNTPYRFANSDLTLYWRNLGQKGNILTLTYDNYYLHSFPLRSEVIGSEGKDMVPTQFSHNMILSYSMRNGRYNLSLECRNFTDEKLYDNFSLQKPGRAFYGKLRIYLGD